MKIPYKIVKPLIIAENVSYSVGTNGSTKLILRDIGTTERPFIINDIIRDDVANQGQNIAIVGRSGGGKSSFFSLLTGIRKCTSGNIYVPSCTNNGELKGQTCNECKADIKKDGYCLTKVTEGSVGFVQQHYPLSRNQTVYQMLWDAAKMGKIKREDRKDLILSTLAEWGLSEQVYNASIELSGGQKQRVAIIEQLLCSHHFMVLDEPFSGLDPKNVQGLKNSFKKITTTDEINTIFFSTHNINLAVELADMIYVIGYEKDANGNKIEGGTIITEFDLKEMGLAWNEFGPEHLQLQLEIENIIKNN